MTIHCSWFPANKGHSGRAKASTRITVCIALLFVSLLNVSQAAQHPAAPSTGSIVSSPEQAKELLEVAKKEFGQLPDDVKASAQEKQLKGSWKRRATLIEEYLTQTDTRQQLLQQRSSLPVALTQAQQQQKELDKPASTASKGPFNKAGYEALDSQLQQARSYLSQLLNQQSGQRQLEENQTTRTDQAQRRIEAASQRLELLTQTAATSATDAERRIVDLQMENTQIDRQIATQWVSIYKDELLWIRESEPLHRLQQEVAEKQIAQLERALENYNQSLQSALAIESQKADVALQQKEIEAQAATSPDDRFITNWETLTARSLKHQRDLQSQLINLKKDESEQDKRLATERDELIAIRDLITNFELAGATAERVKQTLQQVRLRRTLLNRTLRNGAALQTLNQYRSDRFSIEDTLLGLSERFETERAEVAAKLEGADQKRFLTASAALLPEYRNALRDEKSILTEMISLGQNLQLLTGKRLETLNELQRFIRSRAFWLKDTKPLGPEAIAPLPGELKKGFFWLSNLMSAEIRSRLAEVMTTPASLLSALFLFPLLPIGLFYARNRVREVTRSINDRVVAEGKLLHLGALVIITGVISAALVPLYFFIVAKMLNSAQLPAGIGSVGFRLFEHLALFLFLWFFCRSFFARRSITEVQFDLPRPAANAFYKAIRWFLFGYLIWLMPRDIFLHSPFEFEAVPRVFYTLFLISALIGVIRLVRERSPFIQHHLQALNAPFISRNWKTISTLIMATAVAALALDVTGHRYASQSIVVSLGGSLVVLIILPTLYRRIIAALLTFFSHHPVVSSASANAFSTDTSNTVTPAPKQVSAPVSATPATQTGESPDTATNATVNQPVEEVSEAGRMQRILRLLFIVGGGVTLLNLWGMDEQALRTLDEMHLYTVRVTGAEAEFVTAGDFLRFILFLVVTFWTLRILPGLYEVALFPRLKMDEGVKYATLTISRYTLFVMGFFFALAELHMDLGRLGWLMAAIGVGLGFGLQEIVSNFVSGLILLIERPVRPGDTVTIGTLSGKVERINIRATTIVNFDRQEVLVPNRTLITSDVTNWTRTDTINRLVVPIGVAYGSDIDRVGELLMELAMAQPEVLKDPGPSVVFMLHGESSLDFNLRVFVPSPAEIMLLRDRLNRLINKAFAAEGIEIPFPQRDLHVRTLPAGNLSTGTSSS